MEISSEAEKCLHADFALSTADHAIFFFYFFGVLLVM